MLPDTCQKEMTKSDNFTNYHEQNYQENLYCANPRRVVIQYLFDL